MGEAKKRSAAAVQEALVALGVEAIGGRVQVRWNQREAATPFGQMAYFAEFRKRQVEALFPRAA